MQLKHRETDISCCSIMFYQPG